MASIVKRLLGRKEPYDVKFVEDDKQPDGPYVASSAVYIAVVLFIGLPIWFLTCSTTRYSLPNVANLEFKLSNPEPKSTIDISLVQLSNSELTDTLRDDILSQLKLDQNAYFKANWRIRRAILEETKIFKKHPMKNAFVQGGRMDSLIDLESNLLTIHKSEDRFRLFMYLIDESHYPAFCDPTQSPNYLIGFERFVYLCPKMSEEGPVNLVQLIHSVLDDIYSSTVDVERAKQILNPKVDLLLSILPENDNDIDKLSAIADKSHSIFQKNIKKSFNELTELVNIRLITQNVVNMVDGKLIEPLNATSVAKRAITTKELSQLFHRFESRISKHSSQNVNNVLILVPDSKKPPLTIESQLVGHLSIMESQKSSSILIVQDDKSLVLGIRAVIRRLSGLSSVSLCKNCHIRRDVFFNRWESDTIMGVLTSLKLKNVHLSIKSISDKRSGIRIPKDVSAMATEAYNLALKAIENLQYKKTLEAYRLASQAYELSETAYYNPTLLDHPHFPDELKYAIYLPLFLPLAAPFVKSLLSVGKYLYQRVFKQDTPKIKIN